MGRMKSGMRAIRTSASGLHVTAAGTAVAPSLNIAANGQLLAAGSAVGASGNASGRAPAIEARTCSKGAGGVVRPPIFTPRLCTICVSNALVSIATRKPHSGQRNVTVREPSSGPAVPWSFIGSSQSRQRNFMAASF